MQQPWRTQTGRFDDTDGAAVSRIRAARAVRSPRSRASARGRSHPDRRRPATMRMVPHDFDGVDLARLRARRTVKWTLYGPDVLAAWVAEMDYDVAPVVRTALLDAVAREDFGYIPADLTELTIA